ncbi:MAG: DHH family phosphoesterase [Nanoarchaeota archaeon]
MLTEKQVEEIRDHLNKSQNPVFFFDNDCDGLMSFLLLRRYIDRGKGVAIKSFPELDESYVRKVDELNADYIFILDKPKVSKEFIESVKKRNIPLVWIDHHDVEISIDDYEGYVNYYNPILVNKTSEPTSFIAYNISERKEDLWLALIGCVADNFLPDFYKDFEKKYPELVRKNVGSPFELLYESEIGKLIMTFSFALKDRTSNVVSMINFMFKVKSPLELIKEDEQNFKIIKRYQQIKSIYDKLLEKAKRVSRMSRRVVFFQYGGELSLSADLANELSYRFPGKIIIVAYIKGTIANVSIRGSMDVRKLTLEAVNNIPGATGGGHKYATGAKISVSDLPKFRDVFERGE